MSDESANKISAAELEIMKILWASGEALPVTAIRERLSASQGWEATTIKTLVSRLCKKGALKQEKRNVFYYSPLIKRSEYDTWATRDLIQRLYNGSARALVSALVSAKGLTREDIQELSRMLEEDAQ